MSPRELVVVALLFAGCGDLVDAYAHDPRVRAGPVALALWTFAAARAGRERPAPAADRWRAAALAACLIGAILDVNAASHAGLALWLSAPARRRWLLLATSVSWMPLLARACPAHAWACNAVRLVLAAAACLAVRRAGRTGGST